MSRVSWAVITAFACITLLVTPADWIQAAKVKYEDGVQYRLDSTEYSWAMYESRSQTLTVKSARGGVFEFYDVPYEVFKNFVEARLKGGFFRSNLQGHYETQQLSR